MKNRKFGRNLMSSLSSLVSGAEKISKMITPPMEAEEILGKFIDQELPKFLNGGRIGSFSRYYRVRCISKRECILRLNNREVWHVPFNARTYPSRDELAWAIMKGEASPIIAPNGEKVYLYRDDLRHYTITVSGGTWIVSYEGYDGMTQEERHTSMPEVIRQRSRDYLRERCKDGWKGVGRLAFPEEKLVCRVTPSGLVETTSNPFRDGDWANTGRNCLDAPYWVWVGNRAAVADTEVNAIRFYSGGVLTNEISFRCSLLGIAKSVLTSGVIIAVTEEAVIEIEAYKTSLKRKLLYKNPFVLEDGTVFAANEDELWKVIELNEEGKLEFVYCPTTVGLPGKIEKISVHDGHALVVECEGASEKIALF